MILVAELATGHGGDLALAEDMIAACAEAGADICKIQSYSLDRLNARDPQADWLRQAHLDQAAHERLMACCERHTVGFLSTPFDKDALQMLRDLGIRQFKIASSESGRDWWQPRDGERWYISHPWGVESRPLRGPIVNLTAIPLYPTPLECVGRAQLLDGFSDHCEGISAALWAIAQGIQVLEVHVTLAGRSRQLAFDKTPDQIRELKRFAEDCATMHTGVAERFRKRWTA